MIFFFFLYVCVCDCVSVCKQISSPATSNVEILRVFFFASLSCTSLLAGLLVRVIALLFFFFWRRVRGMPQLELQAPLSGM